jgi:hypothetical protein
VPDSNSIFHNLGSMLGNIAAGVFADPNNPPARLYGHAGTDHPNTPGPHHPHSHASSPVPPAGQSGVVVHQHTREAVVMTPTGPITLRRTVIDEIAPGPGPSAG